MIALLKMNCRKWSLFGIAIIFIISGCSLNTSKDDNRRPYEEHKKQNDIEEKSDIDLNTKILEVEIHELIKKDTHNPAEVERIIKSLRDINPVTYDSIDGAYLEEVYGWVYQLDMDIKIKYLNDILLLHDHVDGAATETYCAIIYEIFKQSPLIFVKSLSERNSEDIESISSKLAYHAGYFDLEKIIAETKNTFLGKELSEKEAQTVDEIVKAFQTVEW